MDGASFVYAAQLLLIAVLVLGHPDNGLFPGGETPAAVTGICAWLGIFIVASVLIKLNSEFLVKQFNNLKKKVSEIDDRIAAEIEARERQVMQVVAKIQALPDRIEEKKAEFHAKVIRPSYKAYNTAHNVVNKAVGFATKEVELTPEELAEIEEKKKAQERHEEQQRLFALHGEVADLNVDSRANTPRVGMLDDKQGLMGGGDNLADEPPQTVDYLTSKVLEKKKQDAVKPAVLVGSRAHEELIGLTSLQGLDPRVRVARQLSHDIWLTFTRFFCFPCIKYDFPSRTQRGKIMMYLITPMVAFITIAYPFLHYPELGQNAHLIILGITLFYLGF